MCGHHDSSVSRWMNRKEGHGSYEWRLRWTEKSGSLKLSIYLSIYGD